MKLVVTGIDTEIGKTVVSTILCEALEASYWKPIQAGELDQTDSHTVKRLSPQTQIVPEAYCLSQPISPHAGAKIDGLEIEPEKIELPSADPLIVELAGGVMMPLNDNDLNLDLLEKFALPTIVVASYYLGSINHSLLTLEVLKSRTIDVAGIVFVGDCVPTTKEIILKSSGVPLLAEIPRAATLDQGFVRTQAAKLKETELLHKL